MNNSCLIEGIASGYLYILLFIPKYINSNREIIPGYLINAEIVVK